MSSIKISKNYNEFTFVKGNRPLSSVHLSKLRKSMTENFLPVPIIVNNKMEIVDGQHRFTICKELNIPIHYISGQNWDIDEIRQINSVQKSWGYKDFIKSYMDLEKGIAGPYTTLDWFINSYEIPTQVAISILTGNSLSSTQISDFKTGNLKIDNLEWSKSFCNWLVSMKPLWNGWNKRSFVMAMVILDKDRRFNRKQWSKKLMVHSMRMRHCTNIDDYLDLVEYIYNLGTKGEDKLRFQRGIREWTSGKYK